MKARRLQCAHSPADPLTPSLKGQPELPMSSDCGDPVQNRRATARGIEAAIEVSVHDVPQAVPGALSVYGR
jgi:hypothetical protein